MGCSSSNITIESERVNQNMIQSEMIKREWKSYEETKLKIENLLNDINSKFRDDFYELMDSALFEDIFFNRYDSLLIKNKLSAKDIRNYILDIELISNMCKDNYLEYDMHLIIFDCQDKLFPALSDKNKNELKNLLERNKDIFPQLQRGIYFQIVENNKPNEQLRYCRILKYNNNFNNMLVLTIKMNTKLRNYMVLEEASEIIYCNNNLLMICLYLQFDNNFDIENDDYKMFFECFLLFLENVNSHRKIKCFILIFEDNNSYKLSTSFYNLLFSIVKLSRIISLVIVGVTMDSEERLQKLCESISSNRSIQFLLLHFINPIQTIVDKLCSAISANKNLSIFSLSGGKLLPNQVKDIYSKLSNLRVFNYKSDFFAV